jgi:acetamidase/formamidase
MTFHRLPATPDTVRIGMFDAAIPPVITIQSGDTVEIECVSGLPDVMPPAGGPFTIPPALARIHDARLDRLGPHILTGPVAVEDALPGDMLEVRVDRVDLACDWGYTVIRPLAGTIPEDFPDRYISHIAIDRTANVCKPDWGPALPLSPFFGTMGVAPKREYGRLSSREPREHGGNLDNRELGAGSILYLPVWVPGANFSVGDGHGVQGDGEVCVTALETGLVGTFTFVLHKATSGKQVLAYPRAESPTHHITMGMHATLDHAMETALRQMIMLICSRTTLTREQAYQFCSLMIDFRVTQTVNGEKGIHAMLQKGVLF